MKNDTRRFPLRHQKQGFLVQKDLAVYLFFSELFRQNRPEGCEGALPWELIFRPGGKEVIFRIFIIIHILNFLRNRGIIMASLIYLAPVLGIVALLFAFVLAGKVNKMDEGTDRMQEIAASIREGARAFLLPQNTKFWLSSQLYCLF